MDDVLREVREVREAYAKQFGYDLQAIHRDLKALEQTCARRLVSFPPRRPASVPASRVGTPDRKAVSGADR